MNTMVSSHAQTLIDLYAQQVKGVRKDYGDHAVNQIVDEFAWKKVQKITPEQTSDPRFPEEGPRYVRLILLEEILLWQQALTGIKKSTRRRRSP